MGKEELSKFIKALEKKGLLKFDIKNFDTRFKIQKYVFLAMPLGFNLKYDYSLYLKGPYSTDLANDYYAIDPKKDFKVDSTVYDNIVEKLFHFTSNKDSEWLEIAATMLSLSQNYVKKYSKNYNKSELIEHTIFIKPWAKREETNKIYETLKENKYFS